MSTNVIQLSPAPEVEKIFGIDTRFVMPILITVILLVGQLTFGILESYPQTITAILVSIALEITFSLMVYGKFPHLASAYISGISVGILTRSPEFWPFALCAAISVASKYVIRVKGRHIWNPSNFGISMMILIAPFTYSTLSIQWGNNLWAMLVIWTLGSIIIYRLKRFHITFTYVASFFFSRFFGRFHRRSGVGRDRPDNRRDVPVVHLLYDHRPADDGSPLEGRADVRRVSCRIRGIGPSNDGERPRSVFRALSGRAAGQPRGYLLAVKEKSVTRCCIRATSRVEF
ncbi:MAG: hypothetical protein IPK58_09615 [Acidobacteria bacterium]|nr:hypothetical protein [Acidobacteriota bacterium]